MAQITLTRQVHSAEETAQLARTIAPVLKSGDCLLLEGPIGAGKTHFARALIQSVLLEPEDVPSPTFTLVQSYDTVLGGLWHCDLYRLSHSEEAYELGLEEALESAICLIEWPDRLESAQPDTALTLRFALTGQEGVRIIVASGKSERWGKLLEVFGG